MSNFHTANFELDGVHYNNSEQYIQEQKALHSGDHDVASQIRAAKTALECKDIAKNIRVYNHPSWSEVAKEKCKPGIKAKFAHPDNNHLRNLLLTTRSKQIVEACYDQLWGTGIPLKDGDCLEEDKWTNVGIQGEMLMEIRHELNQIANREHSSPSSNMETTCLPESSVISTN